MIRSLTSELGEAFLQSFPARTETACILSITSIPKRYPGASSGHRYLAMNRGENEGALKTSVEVGQDIILNALFNRAIADYRSPAFPYMASAVTDSYARLIAPSIEREIRADLFSTAPASARSACFPITSATFFSARLKGKCVLGYDPDTAPDASLRSSIRRGVCSIRR